MGPVTWPHSLKNRNTRLSILILSMTHLSQCHASASDQQQLLQRKVQGSPITMPNYGITCLAGTSVLKLPTPQQFEIAFCPES